MTKDNLAILQELTKGDEQAIREKRKAKLVRTGIYDLALEARKRLDHEIAPALKATKPYFDKVARLNFDRLYVYLPAPVQSIRHLLEEAQANFDIPIRIQQGLTELEARDPYAKFEDDYEMRRWANGHIGGLLNCRNIASSLYSLKARIEWELSEMVHTLEYNAGRGVLCTPPVELTTIVRGAPSRKETVVDSEIELG